MNINRESQQTFQQSYSASALSQRLVRDVEQQQQQFQQQQPLNAVQIPAPAQRLNSLDVYRGLTMVGMIMVDNSGPHPPWYLDHADWNGLTPADLIFPSFLFIMGMAVPMATTTRKPLKAKNIVRVFALFGIGVFLNLSARKFTFDHFRILGILQRISVCYAGILLIHVATEYGKVQKRIYGLVSVMVCMLMYITFMLTFDKPDIECPIQKNLSPFCNFSGYVDRLIFGKNHMIYPSDPEGLFSNLTALVTAYAGYYFCLIMKDNKESMTKSMRTWGILCMILGVAIYPLIKLMPLNKKIYSISFCVLTCVTSGLTLFIMVLVVDMLPAKNQTIQAIVNFATRPLIWLGRNPLFVFVFMDVLAILMIKYIEFDGKSAWSLFYKHLFKSWIHNDQVCSVAFSCFFLILWTALAGVLHRKKIFIRL